MFDVINNRSITAGSVFFKWILNVLSSRWDALQLTLGRILHGDIKRGYWTVVPVLHGRRTQKQHNYRRICSFHLFWKDRQSPLAEDWDSVLSTNDFSEIFSWKQWVPCQSLKQRQHMWFHTTFVSIRCILRAPDKQGHLDSCCLVRTMFWISARWRSEVREKLLVPNIYVYLLVKHVMCMCLFSIFKAVLVDFWGMFFHYDQPLSHYTHSHLIHCLYGNIDFH